MNFTYSESFAGMGAWGKAINRVTERHGDTCELKQYWEFDKYASNTFSAIHGVSEELNEWDITKECKVKPVDIFFYSPPCQTFSIAGKREGTTVDKGNLFYEAVKKLELANPKYAIMENVKGLPSGDTAKDFNAMILYLESLGYYNYWAILNSADYGIPHNRERVFVVSIRSDIYENGKRFEFPKAIKRTKKLSDIVEPVVDEKHLLSQKMIDCLKREGTDFNGRLTPKYANTEIANAITTRFDGRSTDNFIYVKSATNCGYEIAYPGDSITLDYPDSDTRRGRVWHEVCQTITTSCNIGYYDGKLIRGLTLLEGFRLQGFDDEDYYKAVKGYDERFTVGKSSTQLKIRIGNSITVNVIEELLENLLYDRQQANQQLSLF